MGGAIDNLCFLSSICSLQQHAISMSIFSPPLLNISAALHHKRQLLAYLVHLARRRLHVCVELIHLRARMFRTFVWSVSVQFTVVLVSQSFQFETQISLKKKKKKKKKKKEKKKKKKKKKK